MCKMLERGGYTPIPASTAEEALREYRANVDRVALVITDLVMSGKDGRTFTEDLRKIKMIRERTKILVSLGDCAVTANVPGMRNPFGTKAVYDRAYRENVTFDPGIPDQVVPALLPTSRPVHEFVKVDIYIPGCPPSADNIYYAVTELLEGRTPDLTLKTRFGS